MGLDVSDLKAGIAEVNKTIKQSKAEFENSVAGLDKWQKSSEGLSAKLLGMPEDVRTKFRGTLTRIVNEGATGLICLIL